MQTFSCLWFVAMHVPPTSFYWLTYSINLLLAKYFWCQSRLLTTRTLGRRRWKLRCRGRAAICFLGWIICLEIRLTSKWCPSWRRARCMEKCLNGSRVIWRSFQHLCHVKVSSTTSAAVILWLLVSVRYFEMRKGLEAVELKRWDFGKFRYWGFGWFYFR